MIVIGPQPDPEQLILALRTSARESRDISRAIVNHLAPRSIGPIVNSANADPRTAEILQSVLTDGLFAQRLLEHAQKTLGELSP